MFVRLGTVTVTPMQRGVELPPVVSTALVGCRTVAEVEDNVGALDWALSEADVAEIDAIFARHGVDPVPERWVEDD